MLSTIGANSITWLFVLSTFAITGPIAPSVSSRPGKNSTRQAQQAASKEQDKTAIEIGTTMVTLPVRVMDRNGKYVADLKAQDFRVYDDDIEQKIAFFAPTEAPVTIALVFDTSGSTRDKLQEMKKAALDLIAQLRSDDSVMVIAFWSKIQVLSEPTSDRKQLTKAIESMNWGPLTSLYDGIEFTSKQMTRIPGRKAVVLLTDGHDTSSRATLGKALRATEESGAVFYPVIYNTIYKKRAPLEAAVDCDKMPPMIQFECKDKNDLFNHEEMALRQLSDSTGGRLLFANNGVELSKAFANIAEELRWQYSLAFYPEPIPKPGRRHKIKVKIGKGDLVVKTKLSYTG